ncbi:MAG: heme-binding protein [Synechococcaceae cyanobacterium]
MRNLPQIALADARALLATAASAARRHRALVSLALVDAGGHGLLLERLDGASPASATGALGKARMAALSGKPSLELEAAINQGRPALLQLAGALGPPALAMAGALPLLWQGHCLGAVGVSGATPELDGQIAAVAVAAWHLLLSAEAPAGGLPQLTCFGLSCAALEPNASFLREGLGFEACGEPLRLEGGPYTALLGLPGASLRLQRLRIGRELVELCQVLDPGPGGRPGRPLPADSRSNDLWFQHLCLVVGSLPAALERLEAWRAAQDVAAGSEASWSAISISPQRLPEWNPNAAGIVAMKFRGPEGHPLELLQFPADKGEARWHQASAMAALTEPAAVGGHAAPYGIGGDGPVAAAGPAGSVLGIDHSAIGVADTARSARFYDELLGLRCTSDGENSGAEQDGLDGLQDVRVRIRSHRCPQGPGIEGLDYRSPSGGRPLPPDLVPQDGAHWQLRLRIADLEPVAHAVESYGGRLISPGIVDLGELAPLFGGHRALQVADPDGHRLQLLEG